MLAVTGRPVEDWSKAAAVTPGDEGGSHPSGTACHDLMALLKQASNPFVNELQRHIEVVAASPWGVQLSAGFSRDRALAAYADIAKRLGDIVAGHDPSIFSTVLRSRGTQPFYQVRIGAQTRGEANSLCGRTVHGGGACLVLRNSGKGG